MQAAAPPARPTKTEPTQRQGYIAAYIADADVQHYVNTAAAGHPLRAWKVLVVVRRTTRLSVGTPPIAQAIRASARQHGQVAFDAFAQATGVARGKADEQQQSYCMLYAACRLLHAAFTPMLDAAARGRGRRAAEAALFGESFRPQHQVCVHEYRRLHRQHTEHLVNSTASSSLGDPTPKHWRAASRNALQCTVLITWQHGTACNRNNPTAQAF